MGATEIERMGAGITATDGEYKDGAMTGEKDNGLFNGMFGECRMGTGADGSEGATGAKRTCALTESAWNATIMAARTNLTI